jgi:DNA-directed RNA polymerase subunit E'/Rpb7
MNYTKEITRTDKIIIAPQELSNVRDYIRKKLEQIIGTCTENDGYVIGIKSIDFKSLTNVVSRVSGNCIYNVKYTISTLKPDVEHVYGVLVNQVFSQGIFCQYNGIQIIVPSGTMDDWTHTNDTFVKDDDIISVASWIQIKIDVIRYDNNNYQCIASLSDN